MLATDFASSFISFSRFIPLAFLLSLSKGLGLMTTYITADNIVSSVEYIVQGPSNDEKPLCNRYIYYCLLSCAYHTLTYIAWHKVDLYYIFTCLTIPALMNRILEDHRAKMVIDRIKQKTIHIGKMVVCERLTHISNTIISKSLKLGMELHRTDFLELLDKFNRRAAYAFFRAVIIAIFTHSAESSYSIIKYAYKIYDGGGFIQDDGDVKKQNRQTVRRVLYAREWEKLTDPDIVRMVIKLYKPGENFFDIIMAVINTAILKMFCGISIASAVVNIAGDQSQLLGFVTATLISFIFYWKTAPKNPFSKEKRHKTLVSSLIRIFGFICGYASGRCFINSFICEFGDILHLNKLGETLVSIANKELVPRTYNKLFLKIPIILFVSNMIVGPIFALMSLRATMFIAGIPLQVRGDRLAFNCDSARFGIVYVLGFMSSFSLLHVFTISSLIGLTNMDAWKKEAGLVEKVSNPKQSLNVMIIDDYAGAEREKKE
jgi:hypothetical protein